VKGTHKRKYGGRNDELFWCTTWLSERIALNTVRFPGTAFMQSSCKAPTSSFELLQILREELAKVFASKHKDKEEWFLYIGHLMDLLM
jgi:hypothetical protein